MTNFFNESQILLWVNREVKECINKSEGQFFIFETPNSGKLVLLRGGGTNYMSFPFFLTPLEKYVETVVFNKDQINGGVKSSRIDKIMFVGKKDENMQGDEITRSYLTENECFKILNVLEKLQKLENKMKDDLKTVNHKYI